MSTEWTRSGVMAVPSQSCRCVLMEFTIGPEDYVCFSVTTTRMATQNTLRAVSQPLGLNEGLNSTIRSAVNSVAIAPKRSMSVKVRSIAISSRAQLADHRNENSHEHQKARKKLRCRPSRQKPGNGLSATSLSPLLFGLPPFVRGTGLGEPIPVRSGA
jgi:hypothetical protein